MVKTMVSCKFSLKPIQWDMLHLSCIISWPSPVVGWAATVNKRPESPEISENPGFGRDITTN